MSNDLKFWNKVKDNNYTYVSTKTYQLFRNKYENPMNFNRYAIENNKPWRFKVKETGKWSSRRYSYRTYEIIKTYTPEYVENKIKEYS